MLRYKEKLKNNIKEGAEISSSSIFILEASIPKAAEYIFLESEIWTTHITLYVKGYIDYDN